MTKRFSFSLKQKPPACPGTCRCARWRSGSGGRSTSKSAPTQHSRELSQKKRRQKFGGWMCRKNLQIHLGLSKSFEVCILNKKNYTWHSIEVQYEGCHEGGLDGEDGDGVREDRSVGEVEADYYERGQESTVGKLAKTNAKKRKLVWCYHHPI